jgi:hypothetical protein
MYSSKYTNGLRKTLNNTQLKHINALKNNQLIDENLKSMSEKKDHKNIFQSMNENKEYKEQLPLMGGNRILNMEMTDDLEKINGSGFWKDFKKGFKKGFTAVTKPAAAVMSVVPGFQAPAAVLHGVNKLVDGAGKPKTNKTKATKKTKRPQTDKMKRRTEKVKEIMKSKNMSMIQASKHIKDNAIPY